MQTNSLAPAVQKAISRGANHALVFRQAAQVHHIEALTGKPKPEKSKATEVFRVTLWRGAKVSHGVAACVNEAISLALADEGSYTDLRGPAERLLTPSVGLMIDDRRWPNVDATTRQELFINTWSALKKQKNFDIQSLHLTAQRTHRQFATSTNQSGEEWTTSYSLRSEVQVRFAKQRFRLHGEVSGRAWASVATIPLHANLITRSKRLCLPVASIPKEPTIVLRPRATARLIAALAPDFTLRNLQSNHFFLTPNAGVTLSPKLHVVDDGRLVGGNSTHAFDDEGVASVPVAIIRDGHLGQGFQTQEEAYKDRSRATGHWFEGKLRRSNLLVRGGTRSINALLTTEDRRSLVVDDIADWRGYDRTTGELLTTVNAEIFHRNESIGAVRNQKIRVNLAQALAQIEQLTSDTDRFDSIDSCGLILKGFQLL